MTGWRNHNRLAWPPNGGGRWAGGSHSRRRAEWPRTAGWPSPRTRGSRRRWVGFPHGRRRDFPRTAGSVSRGRRRELKWRVGFPRQRRPAGMSQRQSSELESAAIRQAWVSGNPAGLNQRQAGGHWVRGRPAGIESEAGRRALSQRRAGGLGLAVDGGVVISCELWAGWSANGGMGEPRTAA